MRVSFRRGEKTGVRRGACLGGLCRSQTCALLCAGRPLGTIARDDCLNQYSASRTNRLGLRTRWQEQRLGSNACKGSAVLRFALQCCGRWLCRYARRVLHRYHRASIPPPAYAPLARGWCARPVCCSGPGIPKSELQKTKKSLISGAFSCIWRRLRGKRHPHTRHWRVGGAHARCVVPGWESRSRNCKKQKSPLFHGL